MTTIDNKAFWIYKHITLNTYEAKCSSCGFTEQICDGLERSKCPNCNAIMMEVENIPTTSPSKIWMMEGEKIQDFLTSLFNDNKC